jgi:hypothetical protein
MLVGPQKTCETIERKENPLNLSVDRHSKTLKLFEPIGSGMPHKL